MKFLPVVTLDDAVYTAIRTGRLRLQRGQWIKIPGNPPGVRCKPSRFVGVRPGWMDIVHPDGAFATGTVSNKRFQQRCEVARRMK